MIFPDSFENKIGFDRIRQMISENCLCQLGRNCVDELVMMTDVEVIEHELQLCDELRKILLFEENFSQDNYLDTTPFLKKIQHIGTYMETLELLQFRKSIATIKNLERYFHEESNKEKYPVLCREFSQLKFFPLIGEGIDSILSKEGKIKDGASQELKQIRNLKKHKKVAVARKIQSIFRTAQQDGLVEPDAEITVRDGRPVIPVAASNKRKLGGLIHDESGSGKTIFIEPGAVVELNNEIRELEYAERREIIKILTWLADEIRPFINELLEAYSLLGRIDFIRAKAKLALKIQAVKPIINKEKSMEWRNAVHPLLHISHRAEGKDVVPLNIRMKAKEGRIVLISGPNAGGKSVCLKTVGLLQYMLQCGLLVPMLENSELCLFENIFIDIGDEQSLENDLSTYSSHLLNMKHFIKSANSRTLLLIDEFGTGTEPALGGAIAEAILEGINAKEVFGVITTHYGNLKHFASETPGIVNGAMLFDTQKIQPLFKLSIGEPGSSFAIEIARNIGLPENILQSATDKVGSDYVNFEKHLREIIRDKKYWEEKRKKIRHVEKSLDNIYDKYSIELDGVQKERKKILAEAQNQAKDILKEANKQIERTIREIKESNAHKDKTRKVREEFEKFKKQIADNDVSDQLDKKLQELHQAGNRLVKHSPELEKASVNKKKQKVFRNATIKKGDMVRMKDMDSIGEVLEVKDKSLLVTFGSMITTIKHSKVQLAENNELPSMKKMSRAGNFEERRLQFKIQLDVRGMRGEEAISKVQEFIDDALVVAVKQVRILHGKGNGILRQLIREFLNSYELIKSIKDEHPDKGGAGITIVELDT